MDLDLAIKQYIKEYFEAKMSPERQKARVFNTIPALIIRDEELESFIDSLWDYIQKLNHNNKDGIK